MIRAIVFDFDGLILDTESNEFKAFQEIYAQHGQTLTLEVWSGCVGTDLSVFNPYDHLEQCLGQQVNRDAIRSLKQQKYDELMLREKIRPGVEAYLQEAKRLGLRIGLASSSSRQWVTGYLSRFGLLDHFDCIRTRDNVRKVKPDPELYLQAVQALGVEPHEAVALEDSPNGALAARRAGLRCVIVPNPVTDTLPFGEHDLRLRTMDDMPLAELVARIERSC